MALTTAEIIRIKAELGFNVLSVGSEPYIGHAAVFEQVIQPYMTAGARTTSSTVVAASDEPAQVTLLLTDPTGFTFGERIVVDVDSRQEFATAQNLAGASLTLLLSKVHTGTYPVTVEGGESIVREYLTNIADAKREMASTFGEGSLKKVDEIEFYQAGRGTIFGDVGDQLAFWRDQLAAALGLQSMWSRQRAAGSRLSVY